ncbi:Rha family transcriptional regulator [Xanthomonas campestris]|uniref:phage antirepressor KilAC domain-containing protein n=1 Tax=Xanthomonas campestris TaxID=339 RepID=UPI002368E3C0|nr:phage antirepressor KilAC domain-containing protein [Xanthomonas campestris]WDJ03377.1 Rha family transcriptional regulator [Xanthomonas campestris]
MSQLMLAGTSPSITSREIAELVEKRHDNVKRTIETLVQQGVIASPQIEEKPTAGRPAADYVFAGEQGKRDSIVVVAQLSPEFTARLVDRWQELERRVAAPADPLAILSDPVALRGLLGTYASRVEELTPKAEALDRIATAEGSLTLREAAKAMQIPERKFLEMLQLKLWIYRHPFSATFFAYAGRCAAASSSTRFSWAPSRTAASWCARRSASPRKASPTWPRR